MATDLNTLKTQMREMRKSLNLPPSAVNIDNLLPLLAPAEFFAAGQWCGPFQRLRNPDIGLTWTVLMPGQTMRYMDYAMQLHWEAEGIDWREKARSNLSAHTNGHPGVYELRRPDGELYALSFMFKDGLGPSRLLFRGSLGQMFPRGYRVAIPERSCGFAWSAQLAGEEMKSLQQTIDNCYRRGTRPFVPGSYDPDDLLPAERRNPSFAPQGDGRVQAGGAPGGYVSRQQSDHR